MPTKVDAVEWARRAPLGRGGRIEALAEDLASEALVAASRQWPTDGIPKKPGAWLTVVAKRRAIDTWRKVERRQDRYAHLARELPETEGPQLVRWDLAREGLRVRRVLAGLVPQEPEAHGLVALMELQSSRFAARTDADGNAVLLQDQDQDRHRWDHAQIRRGREALARADALGKGRGRYGLQAVIAQCHAMAPSVADTDWERIVILYEALGRLAKNPVMELNRAATSPPGRTA